MKQVLVHFQSLVTNFVKGTQPYRKVLRTWAACRVISMQPCAFLIFLLCFCVRIMSSQARRIWPRKRHSWSAPVLVRMTEYFHKSPIYWQSWKHLLSQVIVIQDSLLVLNFRFLQYSYCVALTYPSWSSSHLCTSSKKARAQFPNFLSLFLCGISEDSNQQVIHIILHFVALEPYLVPCSNDLLVHE